jgi:mono/diheme cytochrome c family protein
MPRNFVTTLAVAIVVTFGTLAPLTAQQSSPDEFRQRVDVLFSTSCTLCHSSQLSSGGLNMGSFMAPSSVVDHRDEWELILQKMESGEMPPPSIPRPAAADIEAFATFVRSEFAKADANIKPDPGRVTARRLNRTEYTNTVRDLLGVSFNARNDFPTDDSGHGFDNIADVLTISPVLMERYMAAAETVASRAVGADPLPVKPIESGYDAKDKAIQRLDVSNIQAQHRVGWDAEYIIRLGLPGERSADAAPVKLGFWMDGKLLHEMMAETKPSGLEYFNPLSLEEFRLTLPAGDHTFRAGFIDDEFVKTLPEEDYYERDKNKFLSSITFVGPFATDAVPESRKRILTCDPSTGPACVGSIVSRLARLAYRRPVTSTEVSRLVHFYDLAIQEDLSPEQGIQLAIQAMLVSPHFLFRIERDPNPTDPEAHHGISDLELASRLSYFIWNSMPDEQLLTLAEAGELSNRETLRVQVDRMLADDKSASLAESFAGQWLEIRALENVNPDPDKFPSWQPELRDAMKTETTLFFEAILKENRPMADFLDADFTFLNGLLARHYGIEGVEGPDFRRVELASSERGGILSHGSVLTVTSYPTRTSPVIRGKYVLQNILGTPPPPPPPNVPALDEDSVGQGASLRDQMEAHRANPACATCHARMDALGFGLENYDAIGQWRTQDGEFPVDSSGVLPSGESFETPKELRVILQQQLPVFARNLTEKMLTYSLGRGLEPFDRATVNQLMTRLEADDYRFQTLIHEVVQSLPFLERRGEAVSDTKEIAQR